MNMVVLASILWVAISEEGRGGPRPARVVDDVAGVTWKPRTRAPAFQRLLSVVVELSTEVLAVAAVLAWGQGQGGTVAEWMLPLWVLVQLLMMGLAVGWDADGRARVYQVRITPDALRIGTQPALARSSVRRVEASGGGRGPFHRASLRVEHEGGVVDVAADGDSVDSLEHLVRLLQTHHERRARVP